MPLRTSVVYINMSISSYQDKKVHHEIIVFKIKSINAKRDFKFSESRLVVCGWYQIDCDMLFWSSHCTPHATRTKLKSVVPCRRVWSLTFS